ncbi:MAG: enoyl-CoA hydratase/isomerase family protein [Bacillaceae bacterium]|nr:enoyl-CoA hydratase/isomerase family protein [Bacillaceae bacterium]
MSKVTYIEEQGVGIIEVNSPPVNALDQQVLTELSGILDNVSNEAGVIIITGAGEKAFVAGADINEFPQLKRRDGEALSLKGQSVFQKIVDLKQPVIAAIDGFALGGGLELALACDFRIATPRSQFGLPEVKLGIIPGYGGTQRLPRLIGNGKAKQMIYSGEFLSADQAYHIGLIEEIAESAMEEAMSWAQKILRRGPIAVQATKRAINQGLETNILHGLQIEARLFGEICETEDKNEGVHAFFERREANFTGK